jgi:hypothetical protein
MLPLRPQQMLSLLPVLPVLQLSRQNLWFSICFPLDQVWRRISAGLGKAPGEATANLTRCAMAEGEAG